MRKYKVGDVVLSHGEPIIGYGPSLCMSNQLYIVRYINAVTSTFVTYTCTLVSTGEYVTLLGTEIVEQGADQ